MVNPRFNKLRMVTFFVPPPSFHIVYHKNVLVIRQGRKLRGTTLFPTWLPHMDTRPLTQVLRTFPQIFFENTTPRHVHLPCLFAHTNRELSGKRWKTTPSLLRFLLVLYVALFEKATLLFQKCIL